VGGCWKKLLVFALDLLLQKLDAFLLGLVVGARFGLERPRASGIQSPSSTASGLRPSLHAAILLAFASTRMH
jgi:hypothetical protein